MNTLRLLKGEDINIYIDEELLCFVTSFVAQESHTSRISPQRTSS